MNGTRLWRVVESLLRSAETAVTVLDWDHALDLVEDVLAVDPDNAEAAALRVLAERHVGRARSAAGRRQVTVLFADLVGSTRLGERLDPETYLEVVRSYESACRPLIDRYGGHINRFAGDGLIAFFGYPSAHEDDARRAVHAALGALDALGVVSDQAAVAHGVELAARIGVHTGPVVLGERGSGDWRVRDDAFGPTVNLAARLQAVADPGTVVVSDVTALLVEPSFELVFLGDHLLAGIARPVAIYQVARARDDAAARLDAGVGAFVGRAALLDDLVGRFERTERQPDAPGRAVLLTGEAGVGKTRLLAEMLGATGTETGQAGVLLCSPHQTASPLHPVRRALTRAAGIVSDDPGPARLDKLTARMADIGLAPAEVVPYLALILGVDASTRFAPVELDAQQLHETLISQVIAVIVRLTERNAPYVLAVEDVQWADPMTRELIERLVRAGPRPGLLVVLTGRHPGWPEPGFPIEVVEVGPLASDDVRRMAASVADRPLDDDLIDEVVRRSDGVPLYARQLVDALAAATAGVDPDDIPLPLTELLQSRLDSVGAAKVVAQVAATIGREFEVAVLDRVMAAVGGDDRTVIADHVARLATSHLIDLDPAHRDRLRFHHALVRDAAYASQLHRERQARHRAVAGVFAQLDADDKPVDASLTAYHYDRGGRPERAIGWYLTAAERAGRTGAFDEALAHVGRAEALLAVTRPAEAPAAELAIRLARGQLATSQGGWLAAGVLDDYARALQLCDQVGDDPGVGTPVLRALFGIWSWYCTKGDLDEVASACASIDRQLRVTPLAGGAPALESCRGVEHFYGGRFVESRHHLEAAVAGFADDDIADWSEWQLPNDPMAAACAFLAAARFVLGDGAGASAAVATGLERSATLGFPVGPLSRAFVLSYQAWLLRAAGHVAAAREAAAELLGLAERHGFGFWLIAGQVHVLAAEAASGPTRPGLDALGGAIAAFRGLGTQVMVPVFLLEQADGYLAIGAAEAAGACVDDVLSFAVHDYVRAEALRLRAEVTAARPGGAGDPRVEIDLRAALATATGQGATFYADRTVASWRRLLDGEPVVPGALSAASRGARR